MPGRLIMNTSSLTQAPDLKRDRAHNADDTTQHKRHPHQPSNEVRQTNGASGVQQPRPVNGANLSTVTDDHPLPNGLTHRDGADDGGPPELDGTWRQGEQNKSMGVMMERLAQQAFLDLNDVIGKMSELGQPAEAPASNGILANAVDISDESLQRKRLILDFAKEQRDRFIKTLVLSDWSRNEAGMARLIDIKVWQDKQRFAHANAKHAVGQIKVDTVGARMPNPNIEGAMELMAKGKASWVPDLGYIPPKRLTARQLLRTLRNMNVILATRLNLSDSIPPFMRNYQIANGRVTFTVPGEFEVDLAVADEDPTSAFYFIDLRFLFAPSPASLGERLRSFLEGKVNQALANHGLQGCYDFLHKLALTHKINTLRNQAADLLKGKWFDCLKVESLHRNLVIQYWAGRPGPKHWFEIGITSSKRKNATHLPVTSQLSIRWFRSGKPVDHNFEFDWNTIDVEQCLLRIIAEHSRVLLTETRGHLEEQTRSTSMTTIALESDPTSYLRLTLPSHRSSLECRIEPITGQYSLSPSTPATAFAEHRINQESVEPSSLLLNIACSLLQEQVSQYADLLGWTSVQNVTKMDPRPVFGPEIRQHRLYRCHQGWPSQWALAAAVGISGPSWWIISLTDDGEARSTLGGRSIARRRKLRTADASGKQPDLSPDLMLRVEKLAVAEISLFSLTEDLSKSAMPGAHKMATLTLQSVAPDDDSRAASVSVPIFIRFSTLMNRSNDKKWSPWAEDIVRLTHHGADTDGPITSGETVSVRHDLRLTLFKTKMQHLQRYLAQRPNQDVVFNQTGGMAVTLRTPLGEPILETLRKKLHSIERLNGQVAALQKLGCDCTSVSLTRLSFNYGPQQRLSARIQYSADGRIPAKLKLGPDSNPHLRVRALLEQTLNLCQGGPAFKAWINAFCAIAPLLQTFDTFDSGLATTSSINVRIRGLSRYCLQFSAPHPPLVLQITLRTKLEHQKRTVVWHIEDITKKEVIETFAENFKQALRTVWHESTTLWFGTGKGIIANPNGVSNAVEKLVETVKNFDVLAASSVPNATSAAPPGQTSQSMPSHQSDGTVTKKRQAGTAQDAITLD